MFLRNLKIKYIYVLKETKIMKVAILGAGCYRTHAASGITNFTRACEVAEETGKKNRNDSLHY